MFVRPGRTGVVIGGVVLLALAVLAGLHLYTTGRPVLTLATTTSTYDSGLLDALVPPFEEANRCRVAVVAVGTGQALGLGRAGDADVLLVHAPQAEARFMEEGHGSARHPVMRSDFVIVGPPEDPAGLSALPEGSDVTAALTAVARAGGEGRALFLSRGDDSGTHKKELALWAAAGLVPGGAWYDEVGSGMGETLRMAAERGAYTLSDLGTYLALYGPGTAGAGRLEVLFEGDPALFNPYHVIVVNPDRHPGVNHRLAEAFADYLRSDRAREIIGTFGVDRFGQPLFQVLEDEGPD